MPAKKRASTPAPKPFPVTMAETVASAAALVLVLVVPLVWDVTASSPFRGTQSALSLVAWIALAGVFVVSSTRAAWLDPWLLPWAGVCTAGLISALFSSQPLRSASSLVPVVLAALATAALRLMPERSRLRLRTSLVVAGVIQSLLAIAFRSPSLQPPSFSVLQDEAGRFATVGTLGNPADVAVFLALPAILAASLALEDPRRRLVWGGASALMTGVVISTATLTVVGAMAIGFAVLLWGRVPRRFRLPAVAALVAAAVVAILLGPVARRIEVALHQVRGGDWLWFGSGRAVSFAAAFAMVAARPLTGVGFGLFGAESYRFQSEHALAVRAQILDLVTGFGEAHSEPLQFVAETGVVGALLLSAACILAWRLRPRAPGLVPAVLPLAAVAVLVSAAQFPLHLPSIAAQWAVLASLALPSVVPPPRSDDRARWVRLGALLVIVAVGATVAWNRHRAARAVHASEVLVQTIRAAGPSAPPAELAAAALPRLEERLRWLPYSLEGELAAGNLAIEGRRPQAALRHFARALSLEERPETHFDVGMTQLLLGDREGGLAQLVRAVKLNPAVFKRVVDPDISRALRGRLDAEGYGQRYPWIYVGTPAARP